MTAIGTKVVVADLGNRHSQRAQQFDGDPRRTAAADAIRLGMLEGGSQIFAFPLSGKRCESSPDLPDHRAG